MKVIYSTDNNVEAVMIEGLLKAAAIPVHRNPLQGVDYPGRQYTGAWYPRGYEIVVPDDHAAEATEIIRDYLASLQKDPP